MCLCICVLAFKKVIGFPAAFILSLHENLNSEYASALNKNNVEYFGHIFNIKVNIYIQIIISVNFILMTLNSEEMIVYDMYKI